MDKKVYKKTYFPHDEYARKDPKIKNLLAHFRKENEDKAKAALCVYWWIIEDMHTEEYEVSKLEAYADDYRCDVDFLKTILEDFELFRQEDGCYISDRVIRNFIEREEKSKNNKKAVEKRWENYRRKQREAQEEPLPNEIDEELVVLVIQEFNTVFKKSYIVSDNTKQKIDAISKKNKLTIERWQTIIKNAYRGWDFKDNNGTKIKHDKPTLKRILEDWESFLNDDAHLAPAVNNKGEEEEAAKALDNTLEASLITLPEYCGSPSTIRLEAQKIYKATLPQGENGAIEAVCAYCREVKNA